MVAVPLPVTSSPGARPQESAGRLINAYAVKTEQGARSPLKWQRAPGLRELVDEGSHVGYRGFIEVSGAVIALLEDRSVLITKDTAYAVEDLGALDGSDLVTVAKNGATPVPDVVVVTEDGAFNLYDNAPPDSFADADLPQPTSVAAVKNYFVFAIADGRIFASDLNSTDVNSLSYTTAPGPLVRGVGYRDELFAFGSDFCQVYRDAGLTPFPFDLVATIPIGLAGKFAVAGFEPGFTGTLVWAASDDVVYRLNGYSPERVSTEDVSRAIAETPDKSVLEASVFMSLGNAFWCLTRPGYWSWTLNLSTGTWHERRSYGLDCWRASRTVRAFSTWLAGDRATGKLFEISASVYREGSDPLVFEVESGAVVAPPGKLVAPRLDVDMVAAVGRAAGDDPIEVDPTAEIVWSRDGGYRFGLPVQRSMGQEGDSTRVMCVNRLGLATAKGFKIRIRVSDPVPAILFGATISNMQQQAG